MSIIIIDRIGSSYLISVCYRRKNYTTIVGEPKLPMESNNGASILEKKKKKERKRERERERETERERERERERKRSLTEL